jgi:hypothetical protein
VNLRSEVKSTALHSACSHQNIALARFLTWRRYYSCRFFASPSDYSLSAILMRRSVESHYYSSLRHVNAGHADYHSFCYIRRSSVSNRETKICRCMSFRFCEISSIHFRKWSSPIVLTMLLSQGVCLLNIVLDHRICWLRRVSVSSRSGNASTSMF